MFGEGWKSDEMDQLYDQALSTTDHEQRKEIYTQLQRVLLTQELPNIYTVQPLKFQVIRKRVTGMYVAYTDFNTGLRTACVTEDA
jgi:ABC-type transport system substrate-binding protein